MQSRGNHFQKVVVVFDGYSKSPKDHNHIRRNKNSCCNVQIWPEIVNLIQRTKFLDNKHNKTELIHLLSTTFTSNNINVKKCENDADTSIVREALACAQDGPVEVSNKYISICLSEKSLLCLEWVLFPEWLLPPLLLDLDHLLLYCD